MNSPTVWIPRDAAALAAGADDTADALIAVAAERRLPLSLVRNGSRGMLWREPLLEVTTPAGRVAFGPVQAEDIAGLVDAGLLDESTALDGLSDALVAHPLRLGLVDQLPYFARQRRITFARVGLTDPLSLDDYAALGGWAGLDKALAMAPSAVVGEVLESGLRGRGGAAFPAGIK